MLSKEAKIGEQVLVEWVDSEATISQVWHSLDEVSHQLTKIRSVGFLVDLSPEHVAISMSWDDSSEHAQIGGLFHIPRGCVKRIRRLRLK